MNESNQPERTKVIRDTPHAISRAQMEERLRKEQQELEESWSAGTLLWAEIRRTSQYAGQADAGEKFQVFIGSDGPRGEYVVKGGPGGQYRLSDVYLYAQLSDENDQLIQLTK